MADQNTVALRDLCVPSRSITYGIVQPGKLHDGGVPIVRVNNFRGHRLDLSDRLHVAPEIEANYRRARPKPGDVLISLVGSIGQVAIAPPDIEGWNLARAVGLVPMVDQATARWVYYALQTQDAQDYIRRHANTTVQATFNLKDLARFPIPFPSRREREQVLEVLGSLDDKIELNRRMNETLEAMAQAIFRDWFVDFGPTQRKLDGTTDPVEIMGGLVADADRARELADLFPAKLGDDGLPVGWEVTTISCVTSMLKRGLAPAYSEGGIPVVNQRCIRGKNVDFSLARQHDVEKRAPKERLLQLGDVLVNSTGVGTLGRVATVRRLPDPATADSHVTICRTDSSKISPLVVSLFLEASEDEIAGMGHGSTGQTELNPASLGSLALVVASHHAQRSFESIVEPLRQRSSSNVEQNRILAATRDLLLPKLMSGEIGLSEVEAVLEAAQ